MVGVASAVWVAVGVGVDCTSTGLQAASSIVRISTQESHPVNFQTWGFNQFSAITLS
jgi:hypothetical protein